MYRTDGVDGNFSGATTNVIPAQVWDLQVIGNTVYAAGQFTQVVSAQGSWPRIDQPFLAAFDATSGRYLDWWRPVLDAPVWALDVTPDGSLLVGRRVRPRQRPAPQRPRRPRRPHRRHRPDLLRRGPAPEHP